MAARKGVAMKTTNKPGKLISRRTYAKRVADIQKKHEWLLQGRPLEARPGWLNILDATFTTMKIILTPEDIEKAHLEFLHCSVSSRLQLFLDPIKVSDKRSELIRHLAQKATGMSEETCAKCGEVVKERLFRSDTVCEEHSLFSGDFIEDYRRHQKQKMLDEQPNSASDEVDADTDDPINGMDSEDAGDGATMHRLYDVEYVRDLKKTIKTRSSDHDAKQRLAAIYDDLIKRGGTRPYCRLPEITEIDALANKFPNFQETVSTFKNAVALAKMGNGVLEIPPLLLVGPPGIGKTELANEFAGMFETDYLEVRMETEQSGSTITGSSEFWSNTQTGQLFNTLTTGKTANPIVLLDELDKACIGDQKYSPIGGLYSLLERETAKRFEDQSIRGLKIDASAVIWVITANDISNIPDPIISRVVVQHVRPPTRDESKRIARIIYSSIRTTRSWGGCFKEELGAAVVEKLSRMGPRQMKVRLLDAFGKAALQSRDFISPDDISDVEGQEERRIGFV